MSHPPRRHRRDTFIEPLAAGYETRLSTSFTNGTELSVGQWQRVAIARAFFRDAPLVVMDEPAAALDARAERDLFQRLAELGRDRMVVGPFVGYLLTRCGPRNACSRIPAASTDQRIGRFESRCLSSLGST